MGWINQGQLRQPRPKSPNTLNRECKAITAFKKSGFCSDRSSNNPVAQQKSTCWLTIRPVIYSASPLLSIRKITLFGKWPTPLANGPLGQATGRPVGERSGVENAPLQTRLATCIT
jgi:hypothetical protein